jgi:predicted permease
LDEALPHGRLILSLTFVVVHRTTDPKKAPYLPAKVVSVVARFSFSILTISLVYSTTAIAVSPQTIGDYSFVFGGAFGVISISYVTATILGYLFGIQNPRDFAALRIAASFPNIVSLPILIFPSLCEYEVVYDRLLADDVDVQVDDRQEQCVALANTMIFIYFFAYSLMFWSFGAPQLMEAATLSSSSRMSDRTTPAEGEGDDDDVVDSEAISASVDPSTERVASADADERPKATFWQGAYQAVYKVVSSAGFLAMAAGFLTGCIPPLQQALFDEGGPLRFLGSSVETLGKASSPMSTLIAAAALVPPQRTEPEESMDRDDDGHNSDEEEEEIESPIMSDPHYGPLNRRRRESLQVLARSIRESAKTVLAAVPRSRSDTLRLLFWFVTSRLIVAPAIVTTLIVSLDRAGYLDGVPPMAKLVVLINSCLPGAQMVVVLLKSHDHMADSATAVAQVYLPSYLFSCVTIAGWTSLGLWLLLDE